MSRTYTEAEARKVFARVAERQRARGASVGGLTLGDLEEAARAAGLDPALVAAAAAEMDAPAATRTLLGAPTDVTAQRVVRGRVTDDAWEAMVAAARHEIGRAGIAGQVGRTREWTVVGASNNAQPTTRLALEPAGDDTRIVLSQSVRDAALGLTIAGGINAVMAVVFGLLTLLGVDPEIWIAALVTALMAVAFVGATQVGLRVWERRQVRRFDRLLDRLELAAQADARTDGPRLEREPSRAGLEPADAARGRLDAGLLDAMDDPDRPSAPLHPPIRARS